MDYAIQTHKAFLRSARLIPVLIRVDSIMARRKSSCGGICQNDSGICGFFEGLSMDGDEPAAICSREEGR